MKNRTFSAGKVELRGLDPAVEEILFAPQTSGGLLMSVHPADVEAVLAVLGGAAVVGEVVVREGWNVVVGWM